MDGFRLNLNTVPPQPPAEEQNTEAQAPTEEQPQVDQPIQPEQAQEAKPDEFIELVNKKFGTQFKADDEIKNVFGLPKKVSEYEAKIKESETYKQSAEELKKKIEEIESGIDPLKYFSSPETYIAEQLRIKYPKNNPLLLQEIATTNVDEMSDFDVLVKEKQLFVPKVAKEGSVKAVILKKYGIDPEQDPNEWDEISKTEMAIDAATARDRINEIKKGIELPKIVSKEDRLKVEAESKAQRDRVLAPLKEQFLKFDKFQHGDFAFDVPSEYLTKVPEIFSGMFEKTDLEPTEENFKSMVELRDALFLYEYFPKIKEVIIKEAQTKLQEKVDEQLHNTQPPNTATASPSDEKKLPGLDQFLSGSRLR